MATVTATQEELRTALYAAQRALLHASRRARLSDDQAQLVDDALAEVSRVLDIGRDEASEQGCS